MRERNLLIRASAGTGKTYALATRYLRLMLLGKVDPAKIVALTFSRAAAQEIYSKILERLWTAAESEEKAAKESNELCKGSGLSRSWDKSDFASLLRSLIATQHLGTIATLDSFILRMVRNFPLEMGFQHAVEVLDSAGEGDALQDALRVILQGAEKAEEFIKVFAAAQDGYLPRVLEHKIRALLKTWRKFYERCPDCRNWTVESMLAALGIPEKSECPDLSRLPFCEIKRKNAVSYEEQFVERCRSYDGSTGVFDVKDGVKKLMLHFLRNDDADSYEYDFYDRHYVFNCGKDGADAIRGAIRHMFNMRVLRLVKQVKAKIDFVGFVEDVYNRNSRRKGKLTFSDFTRFTADKEEGSEKAFALANLEYRFDEKFDHWALDEFQDTSELQWACLKSLVLEAATSGGGRTVMTVGDLKQSIYTWRGGNDGPFMEMMSWGAFTDSEFGKTEDLSTSYRYEKNICDFVNAVFGEKSLRASGVLPRERAKAIERWLSSDCWKEHKPVFKDGEPKSGDYIKVLGVPDPEGKAKMKALLPALEDELKRIWSRHRSVGSTESVGILVRKNDDGNEIAEYLRSRGFKVVWEGMSAVLDVPVVNALVDLLRLSEHPGDTFAWKVVSQLFPVCSTLFPQKQGGELSAAYVSSIVSANLSHQGLSRTLQKYRQALSEDSVGLDSLSRQRLRELVGVAVAYEQRNSGRFSIDGFEAFLAASSKREQGTSSDVVRILTIHRSKGLTLDRVIVPLAEGEKSLADPGRQGLLYAAEGGWVLPHLPEDEAALNPKMAKAQSEMADETLLSNIRTYYVALTRARKALYVIAPLAEADAAKPFFRDVIASAVADFSRRKLENGCEIIFEQGVEPEVKSDSDMDGKSRRAEHRSWCHEELAETVERISPSSSGHRDFAMPASYAFFENAGEAAKKGVEIHEQYEAVEWADEETLAALPEAFRVAFMKPGPEATLWREKSYEIYREEAGKGEWETGQFDRVVFTGESEDREAVIYDFKTNALKPDESPEAFERRMCRAYSPQMSAYRAALATLTGLPLKRIRSVLLLESTGTAVECGS